MTAPPGLFISIEGMEGVGKSQLTTQLVSQLTQNSQIPQVMATREPGGSPQADAIRSLFAADHPHDPLTPTAELCLVCAARAQHLNYRIRPHLAAGGWVVCDRYSDSTRVYQGRLGGLPSAQVEATLQLATGGLEPHLTFVLDCDLEVAASRREKRRQTGPVEGVARFDTAAKAAQEALRQGFLELAAAHPERITILNADRSPAAITADAYARVLDLGARYGW